MNRKRQCQNFTDPIQSFILEESRKSNLSTSKISDTSKSYITSKSSSDVFNKTIDLSNDNDIPFIDLTAEDDDNNLNHVSDSSQQKNNASCQPSISTSSELINNLSSCQSSEYSFHTALSKVKLDVSNKSSVTSIERDSLDESNYPESAFKENVKKIVLRRLSYEFQKKPIDFTRKLVSILEESFAMSTAEDHKKQDISLDKITDEFIKLCKFIEDESMPDLVPSMYDTTIPLNKAESSPQTNIKHNSPLMNQKNSTPQTLFRDIIDKITSSPKIASSPKISSNNSTPCKVNNDTNTFEFLEKFCDDLYKDESDLPKHSEKNLLPPLNTSTTSIYTICEQQLASLEDTEIADAKSKNVDSMSTAKYYTPTQSFTENKSPSYDTNIMEKSIMEEIVKYKQRVMDFAKQMDEIEKESNLEIKKSKEKETTNNIYLLEMLNRCMEYKDVLVNKSEDANKLISKNDNVSKNKLLSDAKNLRISKTPVKVSTTQPKKAAVKTPGVVKSKSLNKVTLTPSVSNKKISCSERKATHKNDKLLKVETKKQLFKTPSISSGFVKAPEKELSHTPLSQKKVLAYEKRICSDDKTPKVGSRKQFLRLPRPDLNFVTPPDRIPLSRTQSNSKILMTPHKKSGTIDDKSPVALKVSSLKKDSSSKHVLNLSQAMENVINCGVMKKSTPSYSPRGMYFVTPGNNTEKYKKRVQKKGAFFTDQHLPTEKTEPSGGSEDNRVPLSSVNRLKYPNVISPISKYINYKNTHLLKNVHAVTNDMLLTPEKGCKTETLKIPLSPKTAPIGNENADPYLPQVYYKRPDEVQVIKQSPRIFPCKGVLESINNKVVLKHTGRVKNENAVETSVMEEKQAF